MKNVFLRYSWEYEFKHAVGVQVTWCFRDQLFLLPSAIAYLFFAYAFLKSYWKTVNTRNISGIVIVPIRHKKTKLQARTLISLWLIRGS